MSFPNSPISEAIFDIKVNLPDGFEHEKLLIFQEKVRPEFPHIRKQMQFSSSFKIEEGIPPEIMPLSSKQEGYLLISEDEKRVVQVRLDGFTFSRLRPYPNWEVFYGEAYKLWEFYRETALPQKVIRVALRYINRIMIPLDNPIELNNYIKTVPEIPDELSVTLVDYFMRLVVISPEYKPAMGIINQTIERKPEIDSKETNIPLIFDIDVFQEVSLSPDDTEIKNIFEQKLRSFRNKIFFNSITEKTQELFQ